MKCIYAIVNLKTGKKYIGSASNFARRKNKHLKSLTSGTHHSLSLQASFNKHGAEHFHFIVIKQLLESDDRFKHEQYYLDLYKPHDKKFGYNMSAVAKGVYVQDNLERVYQYSPIGELLFIYNNCIHASDINNCDCSGISKACRGGYRSYKNFIWLYEKDVEELSDRLHRYHNKIVSSETREKMRQQKLGKRLKPVTQYDLQDTLIKEWPSTTAICQAFNYSNSFISECINGKHNQIAYGYKWKKAT
jgi:group I intron endonuclease